MVKKIVKHGQLALARAKENQSLKKIDKQNNATLDHVIKALQIVKSQDFNNEDLEAFARCENYRNQLLQNHTEVSYKIFGSDKIESVKNICKAAASGKKWAQLLYFLTKRIDNPYFLEIGTNLGISGAYILEGMKTGKGQFITMEGLKPLCEIATDHFKTIVPEERFSVRQGVYETTFPVLIKENHKFNIAFIDGNHQKEPTVHYFNSLLEKIQPQTILIFDDINWSKGMQETWKIIIAHPKVNYYIDLYKQGIVIIDETATDYNIGFSLFLDY